MFACIDQPGYKALSVFIHSLKMYFVRNSVSSTGESCEVKWKRKLSILQQNFN